MPAIRSLASDPQRRADVLPARPRPGQLRELAFDPVEDCAELGHVPETLEGNVVRQDDRKPVEAETVPQVELMHTPILDPVIRPAKCPDRTCPSVNPTSRDSPWFSG